MGAYARSISADTGVTNQADLDDIEDCMRHDIFHSTLDWQSREQFAAGAREAWALVQALRGDGAFAATLVMAR